MSVLDASNNIIDSLSEKIAYFSPILSHINLENNSLNNLPTVIGFMNLSNIKIDGNPFKTIKRAIIDKGTVSILDFLRNRHIG